MPSKSKVYFFFNNESISLKDRRGLKKQVEGIFKGEGKSLESLNYIFCSDSELLKINKKYLGHHFLTDIITFDLTEQKGRIVGEIYISTDRVRDNARKFKTTIAEELKRVVFHGALHLCGYKDKSLTEKRKMRQKEDFYLEK